MFAFDDDMVEIDDLPSSPPPSGCSLPYSADTGSEVGIPHVDPNSSATPFRIAASARA
jgi:hypothetical protein